MLIIIKDNISYVTMRLLLLSANEISVVNNQLSTSGLTGNTGETGLDLKLSIMFFSQELYTNFFNSPGLQNSSVHNQVH